MFRNQYDSDVSVWSPQGRLFQLEYACEAVKQGSATLGLKSKTHALLIALKRAQNDLCDHHAKIVPVANHCALSMSGLTADGRSMTEFMRQECLNEEFVYNRNLEISALVGRVGDKMQLPTQQAGARPFGVGLLVIGYDSTGPHLFEIQPNANFYDCKAMAIGARSQSARTYIEKHLDVLDGTSDMSIDDLIKRGLEALRETLPSEMELSEKNVSICFVSKDSPLETHDNESVTRWLNMLDSKKKKSRTTATTTATPAPESTEQTAEPPAETEMQE